MSTTTPIEPHLTHRERVRAAGLSGDYWYPAMWSGDLKKGEVKEVVFWKESIAVYRGDDGVVRAIEDRCAHRHVKMSLGVVQGCDLACGYHGWQFDGGGECTKIPHEVRTKNRPDIRVGSFPVTEKYGIVWVFPGDPEKAQLSALPHMEPVEKNWATIPVDYVVKCHHSMIVENVCDFYHEFLHRDYRPFASARFTGIDTTDDSVEVRYETKIGGGPFVKYFADSGSVNLNTIKLWYEYPFQRSDIDGKYLHWLFLRPIDEQTTHIFYVFTFKSFKLPFVKATLPRWLQQPVMALANKLYVQPVLGQDNWIMEAEQVAHNRHGGRPSFEFNPFVPKAQQLTMKKWDEYEASLKKRVSTTKKAGRATESPSAASLQVAE
ncbi:MAG: aromatic ring-hydroxylating dioxygenase subunit alpha [Deltaproteobacteria bacterium]|nr:aromatic ring-hydroxylating dioxygenase subunit alpha [Deltaproteobacteria bacterium]